MPCPLLALQIPAIFERGAVGSLRGGPGTGRVKASDNKMPEKVVTVPFMVRTDARVSSGDQSPHASGYCINVEAGPVSRVSKSRRRYR
jgi:hypothetical protein